MEKQVIGDATLYFGGAEDILPELSGIDACVVDPPYGLKFMGKRWDYAVPSVELWELVLATMKLGAHLLSFAGTRMQHRMAVNIEDAGFEIRDMIAWVYGSGFPKSLNVSKAIDAAAGAEREVVGPPPYSRGRAKQQYSETRRVSYDYQPESITVPTTDAAKQWDGWGTALKPAFEPITFARKPLSGTVATNVQEHGTGALNIDGCRVPVTNEALVGGSGGLLSHQRDNKQYPEQNGYQPHQQGRFPANLIHDGSDEVLALFPVQSGGGTPARRFADKTRNTFGVFNGDKCPPGIGPSSGSAARFFYCAKASRAERGEGNNHPTVKPIDLMRYLCRLVTPPGGVVLDQMMGSGSTGVAAMLDGFRFVGIEREREAFDIACRRIEQAQRQGRLAL